ncbi:hypothetical protein G5714_023669 [Onychostoma macrolepis]|uniref:Uncharacterized protein n=1 Tax=Onychostoma macrolepis TaxID=369639 RepID=A0A7J6BMB4_9TELE|nr:hypothetical protein G5714_023669 [Onychostoma macrolepis]
MVFLRGSNRQLARCEKPDVSVHPSLLSQAWMKTCLKRECKPGADVPAIEAVNTSVPGSCSTSTSTATVTAETPAQPAAASGCVNDLGEKATGPKQPILSFFPKHQIGDINLAFSSFY